MAAEQPAQGPGVVREGEGNERARGGSIGSGVGDPGRGGGGATGSFAVAQELPPQHRRGRRRARRDRRGRRRRRQLRPCEAELRLIHDM